MGTTGDHGWLDVPMDELAALTKRLRASLDVAPQDWPYSVPAAYVRDLVGHWCDHYDWTAHAARLNAHPLVRLGGRPHLHVRARPATVALPVVRREWPDTVLDILDTTEVDALIPLVPWIPDSLPAERAADTEALAAVRAGRAASPVRRLAAGSGLLAWHAQVQRDDLDRDRMLTGLVLTFFGPTFPGSSK
jgi:hypothetical protein